MTARTRTDVLLLAGFCAFLFFYGIGQFGLIGADEPRYAQVAREMLDRHDWVTPVLQGRAWLEKPPLYYWQAMLAYSVFGISDVTARIPSAIDATLLVVTVYLFFRRFRRGVEVDAALITASCAGLIGYSRAASTDMPLTAAFGMGMLAWWAWRESGTRWYLAGFYLCMALGTLSKGPVAPLLAGMIIVLWAVAVRQRKIVFETLWGPGILLFCVVSLPWYVAVQVRNPQFFHEFILEHNLARFSTNLYHHPEPFWYYLPVAMLALLPWIVFIVAAMVESISGWSEWNLARPQPDLELQFRVFACCWLILPVAFFSISQSKLPGYILPALPAGTVLLADYLRTRSEGNAAVSKPLAVLHALVASAPMVPAVLVGFMVSERRLPAARAMIFPVMVAVVVCVAIALTLMSRTHLKMFRFVTLIPVVLAVAAVLKMGTLAIDQKLSTRPLAVELASVETHKLPMAVCGTSREVEYGLAFYRDQVIARYETGNVPAGEHLLVVPPAWMDNVKKQTEGRRVSFLGHYAPQNLDYYWVAALNSQP